MGYSSLSEAIRDNTYLKWIIAKNKVNPKYLLQCMKKFDPSLCQKKARTRPLLTDAQKKDRLEKSLLFQTKPDSYFDRIFWIDSKTLYMSPGEGRGVWSNNKHQHPVLEDARFKPHRRMVKLNYYACVN